MILKVIMGIVVVLIFSFTVRLTMLGPQSQKMNPQLGVKEGRLLPCGVKPNCKVSFYPEREDHFISPLESNLDLLSINEKINKAQINFKLIKKDENYLYYQFESSLLGFVDDIEILVMEGKIHFRSASRVGYSDLGANEQRINMLKELLK
jgi:uncharacterized protein (DUF1499 family)